MISHSTSPICISQQAFKCGSGIYCIIHTNNIYKLHTVTNKEISQKSHKSASTIEGIFSYLEQAERVTDMEVAEAYYNKENRND